MIENIKERLKTNSKIDNTWLIKSKRRRKYQLYYNLIFWLKLKCISYKKTNFYVL